MPAGKLEIEAALADVMKTDQGRLHAALIRQLGDFQLAEDVLQDAAEAALTHWGRAGVPNSPQGWLLQVARRKAIDRLRRARTADRGSATYELLLEQDQDGPMDREDIPDERLRLIFTCCHPALEEKSRIALTLRMLGGLSTPEIARAFLDSDSAMGQRISRAKAKIAAAGIAYRVPEPEEWPERLASVCKVIYLIFNEGYSASEGDVPIRAGLCEEAIFLARLVNELSPEEAEFEGLLALMLLAHARRGARLGAGGLPVAPEAQDRKLWDREKMQEGEALLDRAVARRMAGPFQLQAAISALHMQAPAGEAPDWRQIILLYDRLMQLAPSPVVALNRAVALAQTAGVGAALEALDALADALADYQPFHAARADLLVRSGRHGAAAEAYRAAIALTRSTPDKRLLETRLARLDAEGDHRSDGAQHF